MIHTFHRYVGLVLILFVMAATLSGALLLWSDEYHQWRYPALAGFERVPEPDAVLLTSIGEAAGQPVRAIVMPSDGLPAYHAYRQDLTQAYHDARTGELIAQWAPLESLHSFLFELHVRLLTGEPGHIAVGIAGLAMVFMVVSGIALWWSRRRVFKLRRWVPRGISSPRLMNAHAAQGALMGALVVVVALTGAGMVFHKQAEALLVGLLGSTQPSRPAVITLSNKDSDQPVTGRPDINWPAALASAAQAFPDATLRIASLPQSAEQPLTLRLKQPGELHSNGRSYLVVHPTSGTILRSIDATQTGAGPAVYNAFYPLHAGKTGWPGYRLLLLVLSLALLYLAISGSWVFLRRRKKTRALVINRNPTTTRGRPTQRTREHQRSAR